MDTGEAMVVSSQATVVEERRGFSPVIQRGTVKCFRLGGKSFCYHSLLESHLCEWPRDSHSSQAGTESWVIAVGT